MPAARLCPDCGKKIKSERHLCQPSAVDKQEQVDAWRQQQGDSEDQE